MRQLDKSLAGHRASGDALVASVYGEWGIGKTYCLKGVHDTYQQRLDTRLDELSLATASLAVVVPVWFAPWRYEHEEHLVVPMLKTIEFKLAEVAKQVEAVRSEVKDIAAGRNDFIRRAEGVGRALKRGAETTGRLAQALLSGIKFKAAPLGIGIDVDPKSMIEQSQKFAAATRAEREKNAEARSRESMYFDAQAELEALTDTDNPVPLQLVVLVDDLDRCMPEKAVQVLESVKLFLNVPGFSFVLAIDDEVVERGIAHRYRDYRLADKDGGFSGDVPISGTQYLEKIVHLPVHLPRWTKEKARQFLQSRYPELYGAGKEAAAADDKLDASAQDPARASRASTPDPHAAAVLELVLKAVPLVPRKLIRLSEGVGYLREQFAETGQSAYWSALHAVRVVGLQQLHPTVYRHVRQRPGRYWRLFEAQRDTWNEPRFRSGDSLSGMREAFSKRGQPSRATVPAAATAAAALAGPTAQQLEVESTGRENLSLLEAMQHSGSQRGAGDPIDFFEVAFGEAAPEPSALGMSLAEFCDLYFGGAAPPQRPAPTPMLGEVGATESSIIDAAGAVAALLSGDAVTRREFIESQDLAGKRLPGATFDALLQSLRDRGSGAMQPLVMDLRWLRDIAAVTSAEQLLRVYAAAEVVKQWVESTREGAHAA